MDKINKRIVEVALNGDFDLMTEIRIAMLENSTDFKKALPQVAKRLFNEVTKDMELSKEEKLRTAYRVKELVKDYARKAYYGRA